MRSLPLLPWKCPSPLQVDTFQSCPPSQSVLSSHPCPDGLRRTLTTVDRRGRLFCVLPLGVTCVQCGVSDVVEQRCPGESLKLRAAERLPNLEQLPDQRLRERRSGTKSEGSCSVSTTLSCGQILRRLCSAWGARPRAAVENDATVICPKMLLRCASNSASALHRRLNFLRDVPRIHRGGMEECAKRMLCCICNSIPRPAVLCGLTAPSQTAHC